MQARLQINDLFTDLADGKMLMKLLEIISGENLGRPNKGLLRVQKVENCNRCLKFLATKVSTAALIPKLYFIYYTSPLCEEWKSYVIFLVWSVLGVKLQTLI